MHYQIGSLLDHIGSYVDPLRLVERIPLGLKIPRLRDRLVHIIADFRTQTSLREGCNAILAHDCRHLAQAPLGDTLCLAENFSSYEVCIDSLLVLGQCNQLRRNNLHCDTKLRCRPGSGKLSRHARQLGILY